MGSSEIVARGNLTECWGEGGGGACDGLASHPARVAILLAALCHRNWSQAPRAMSRFDLKGFTFILCR